jgi:hypothetical protein
MDMDGWIQERMEGVDVYVACGRFILTEEFEERSWTSWMSEHGLSSWVFCWFALVSSYGWRAAEYLLFLGRLGLLIPPWRRTSV